MEEKNGASDALSLILDSNEADNKSLTSDIDGFCENVSGPQLCHDVILELAKYLDHKTIKSARLVSSTWNEGLQNQFRSNLMLKAGFSFDRSIQEFISVFGSNVTLPNAIWIQKPKFLAHQLMTKWLESYGGQLTTIKLGNYAQLFPLETVASILTKLCPNLKVLEITSPFLYKYSLDKSINPDSKEVNVALDYLEIGHEDCYESDFNFTSRFLLRVLKCIKSVKSVKINAIQTSNLHGDNGILLETSPGDDYAKQVFENIEELDLACGNINPRRLFNPTSPEIQFQNLQKLQIGCFCICQEGSPMDYLPGLLASIKDHLKELVFYPCPSDDDHTERFACPDLEDLFLSPMPKIEIFKMLEIHEWNYANLHPLDKLPALKELHISLDDSCEDEDSSSWPNVKRLFTHNKLTNRHIHETMERLTFRSFTKSSKNLDDIRLCFPNLKKLEVNFAGTPVFSVFWMFKKLKDLTIHLCEPLEGLDFHDLEGISGSVIEKLCLEQSNVQFQRPLSSIVEACLTSTSLKELKLKGMKVSRKEYEFSMGMLYTAKLKMWLMNCEICEKVV